MADSADPSSAPLICASHHPKACDPATHVCERFVECNKTHGMVNACYAAWSNDSVAGVKLKLKGCWLAQAGNHNNCDQDRCVTNSSPSTAKLANAQREDTTFFCCCSKPKCNEQVILESLPSSGDRPSAKGGPTNPKSDGDGLTSFAYAIAPILLLALFIVVGYWLYRRYKLRNKIKRLASVDGNGVMMTMRTPSSPAVPLKPIQLDQEVARGRYGTVWRASMGVDQLVAVKKFPPQDVESWSQERSIYRISGLKDNKNILRFIAAEVRGSGAVAEYWLITAFQENGSLYDYLKTHSLTLSEFLNISIGTMNGLAFLHEERGSFQSHSYKPTIVHRDFKSRNVLLSRDLSPCIADFGLAVECVNGRTAQCVKNQVGTRRYMAPEVLQGSTDMNAIAFVFIDVYAAALVVWELLSRCTFVDGKVDDYKLPFEEVGPKPSLQDLQEYVVEQKKRPVIKDIWKQHPQGALICSTIEEMWDMEPEARIMAGLAFERFSTLRSALLQSSNTVQLPCAGDETRSAAERSPLISDYQPSGALGAATV